MLEFSESETTSDIIAPVCLGRVVSHRSRDMRFATFLFLLPLLVGCAHNDPRLRGTWQSNQEATVAAAFRRDPRWTNAPPEKVERFRNMFGQMTITYSNGLGLAHFHDSAYSFRYHVVRRGADYVVIRDNAPMDMGREVRIRFVDGDRGYWIDTGPLGFGLEERFDRVQK